MTTTSAAVKIPNRIEADSCVHVYKSTSKSVGSCSIIFLGLLLTLTIIFTVLRVNVNVAHPSQLQKANSFVFLEALLGIKQDQDNDCAIRRQALQKGFRLPVAWVHFPKCGTNFLNTIFHSVCCADRWSYYIGEKSYNGKWLINDLDYRCHGGFSSSVPNGYECFSTYHNGYGPYAKRFWGNAVALFRQPEQRMLSGWFHKTLLGIPHSYYNPGK